MDTMATSWVVLLLAGILSLTSEFDIVGAQAQAPTQTKPEFTLAFLGPAAASEIPTRLAIEWYVIAYMLLAGFNWILYLVLNSSSHTKQILMQASDGYWCISLHWYNFSGNRLSKLLWRWRTQGLTVLTDCLLFSNTAIVIGKKLIMERMCLWSWTL